MFSEIHCVRDSDRLLYCFSSVFCPHCFTILPFLFYEACVFDNFCKDISYIWAIVVGNYIKGESSRSLTWNDLFQKHFLKHMPLSCTDLSLPFILCRSSYLRSDIVYFFTVDFRTFTIKVSAGVIVDRNRIQWTFIHWLSLQSWIFFRSLVEAVCILTLLGFVSLSFYILLFFFIM